VANQTLPKNDPVTELEKLRGAKRLSVFLKEHDVPASTGYQDADAGILQTFIDQRGIRRVTPEAGLQYLTGGSRERTAVRGAAKQRQAAAAGGDA
jgi:hypothetical protein